MHPDNEDYFKFTAPARLDKAINVLIGILQGISADNEINGDEIKLIDCWINDHKDLKNRHPFSDIFQIIDLALANRVISDSERDDLIWLCNRLRSTEYYDEITADIQQLHGFINGIVADGIISETELHSLRKWMSEREHLCQTYPYDEVSALISIVLADGKISDSEHEMLMEFLQQFSRSVKGANKSIAPVHGSTITGVCSLCPDIIFPNKIFCFTGSFKKYSRKECHRRSQSLGAYVADNVHGEVDYLVIGSGGNPCWAYSCYGRKVEHAIEMRKNGYNIVLVHENDFCDALADQGLE